MRFIKPKNLTAHSFILDVRSPEEYAKECIKMPHVFKSLDKLNPAEFMAENQLTGENTINILCASGGRASQAAEMFEKAGYHNVTVVIGGIVEAEYEGLEIVRH